MLRSVYCSLLRLHPAGFRRHFADEMLSIFDDERKTGKAAALGLVLDAARSVFRQWMLRPESWQAAPAPAAQLCADVPSFYTIDPFRPRVAAVMQGVMLSLAVFCVTCFAIRYSWIHVLHVRIPEFQAEAPEPVAPANTGGAAAVASKSASSRGTHLGGSQPSGVTRTSSLSNTASGSNTSADLGPSLNSPASSANDVSTPNMNASAHSRATGSAAQVRAAPTVADSSQAPARVNRTDLASNAAELQQVSPVRAMAGARPSSSDASASATPAATVSTTEQTSGMDAAEKQRVIDGAVANLEKYYVDAEVAHRTALALREHLSRGDDDAVSDPPAFADLLTSQMGKASHDEHLVVVYHEGEAPAEPREPTPQEIEQYRERMKQTNCNFEKVEVLARNIGYLKLNSFPDPSICQPTLAASMAKLNNADAVIFDLRDNRGGASQMVSALATYLVDRRTHLNDFYDRGNNSTEESWTLAPVAENKLANKPVYILTSSTTFSAAEGFSYDLKMLKRATLVGETTSGAGHMGMPHRIDDHFTIRVPGIRVTNPISGTNWEGKGVEPDVKVKASEALPTAQRLAERRLEKRNPEKPRPGNR